MQRLQLLLKGLLVLCSFFMGGIAVAATTQPVQLIVPKLVTVTDQKKCIEDPGQEYCLEISLTLETTGLPWLDNVLLERLDLADKKPDEQLVDIPAHLQELKQHADSLAAEQYADIKAVRESDDPYFISYDTIESIRFIAQRHHLASFKQFSYSFSGGAHGMHSTSYLLFDLNTRRQLLLADILQPFTHLQLFDELRERYQQSYPEYEQNWLNESRSKQAQILLTDNFVFNEKGLTFSYPPYVLGPYSEGEVRLSLDYDQIKQIVKPEYFFSY